jgi:hypothetical protein
MTPPASSDVTTVAGRRVKIVRGPKSQTVNICTAENEIGRYEITYRLSPHVDVAAAELAEVADLEALKAWLLARDAEPELPAQPGSRAVPSVAASLAGDAWVADAQAAVDGAITSLVEQFLDDPYLHRVEHSLHTLLHLLMAEDRSLAGTATLATGHRTQLIHKEWPETVPRAGGSGAVKRGNFDFALVAPTQVAAANLDQFRAGRLDAPIAIEVGLDYGLWHLEQDAKKLLNSGVRVPYLLHLSRVPVTDQGRLETTLCAYGEPLRTAYAHIDPRSGERRVKHIADSAVRVL